MERLYLTRAWSRNLWGGTNYNPASRFLSEVPSHLLKKAVRGGRKPDLEKVTGPTQSLSGDEIGPGDRVRHAHWGEGTVSQITGAGDRAEAVVAFDREGNKRLLLAWAPLERV
jgi:DNA helicase-2/ATP-dependent DNA helicase PcrA